MEGKFDQWMMYNIFLCISKNALSIPDLTVNDPELSTVYLRQTSGTHFTDKL